MQTLSRTEIMKVRDTNHVAEFHDLLRTLSQTSRHVEMVYMIYMICVRDFSPRVSFGESRRNGIWALPISESRVCKRLETK